MGQKVHPYGFRLGYNKDWHSHWFAKRQFGEFLLEDLKLKRDLKQRFAGAGVSHVDIERAANRLKIIIYTSRPGIIIGRKGAEIDKLKSDLSSKTGREVLVSIQEIHKPELNAQLQAEKIAAQLEKRIAFRRARRAIALLIQRRRFQERQAAILPASGLRLAKTPVRVADPCVAPSGRREKLVRIVVQLPRQRNLFELVRALGSPGRFTRRLDRRQQQRHQHADDGNHHQQLN